MDRKYIHCKTIKVTFYCIESTRMRFSSIAALLCLSCILVASYNIVYEDDYTRTTAEDEVCLVISDSRKVFSTDIPPKDNLRAPCTAVNHGIFQEQNGTVYCLQNIFDILAVESFRLGEFGCEQEDTCHEFMHALAPKMIRHRFKRCTGDRTQPNMCALYFDSRRKDVYKMLNPRIVKMAGMYHWNVSDPNMFPGAFVEINVPHLLVMSYVEFITGRIKEVRFQNSDSVHVYLAFKLMSEGKTIFDLATSNML
jgi:hypothetical protein